MSVVPSSADEAASYRQLFDRTGCPEQFADLRATWKRTHRTLSSLPSAELARLKRRLQRDLDALQSIDFFPSESSIEADAAWLEFSKRIDAFLRPMSRTSRPDGFRGSTPPSTAAAPGRRAVACGSIGSRAPG